MNKNDASVQKILIELGLKKETPLTEEQEATLKYATDPDFKFAEDVKRIYSQPQTTEKK